MVKLWGTKISDRYITVLTNLGPLAYFEGLLSIHGLEKDLWGDMVVAVEDLSTVNFVLTRNFER